MASKLSETKIRDRLNSIQSPKELEALVGELTPEEKELPAAIEDDPNPDDFELDPQFTERIIARVLERIKQN